jgi:hypothetical protein
MTDTRTGVKKPNPKTLWMWSIFWKNPILFQTETVGLIAMLAFDDGKLDPRDVQDQQVSWL